MGPFPELSAGRYVVMAAWRCIACDVQGRSLADTEVTCWNCGGQVTVTAKPSIPRQRHWVFDDLDPEVPIPPPRAARSAG